MATPIGTLVVEMQANTAKFRADMDRASNDAKGFGKKATDATRQTERAFQQVASAGRSLAQRLAADVSPAVADAAAAVGVMGRSLTQLPIAAGVAVTGIVALAIVVQQLATSFSKAQEEQLQLFLAMERGDLGAVQKQLRDYREEFARLNQQIEDGRALFDRLKAGDIAGAFGSAISAIKAGITALQQGTTSGQQALDKLREKAQDAGRGLAQLIRPEVAATLAAFQVQVQQVDGAVAQFQATLAEAVNDEEAFTRATERAILALKTAAGGEAEVARLKAEEQRKKALSDTKLSADALLAVEGQITDEYQQQLVLISKRLELAIDQARERQRTGVLGIRERGQTAFPAEPGIEDVGRYEGMAAGIAVDAETLARARAAAKGYDSALADLRATQILVGDASGNLAAQQSLILGQMQKLIADGLQPQDAALTSLAREYADLGRAMNMITDQAVVDALAQQTAELSMTTREVARYQAQLQLSADASDAVRERVGEMAARLDDQRQAIADAEQITAAFSAGLVDLAIDMENFDPREFLKGIAKMILAMAIARLAALALKAAIGAFAPTAPAGDFSGVGADVLRGVPATASGGVVTSPQVRMVGDAGPEAIIPLSQLGGGEVNVSVEIINQTGTPVSQQTEQTTGPDGQRMLRVFLRKEVAGAIGDGSLDPVMSSAFGLKRKGVSR